MYNALILALGAAGRPPQEVFELHPDALHGYLEGAWASGSTAWNLLPGGLNQLPRPTGRVGNLAQPVLGWPHLIYAYMIENTRIYEIFWRVIQEFTRGERLGPPASPGSAPWLRTTESLWYRHGRANSVLALESEIRNDARAIRRNAYYRMFGMDLNHGGEETNAYGYHKPDASNRGFVATFEEFLREVWIGIEYAAAINSANPTDDAKIASLVTKLYNMLTVRRQGWMLSREEFAAVAMTSWLHLTVTVNSPIVVDLRAQASHPSDRLAQIGERVGLPPHKHSFHYFEMALAVSNLLVAIESGLLNGAGAVPALYAPPPNPLRATVETVITHWGAATGRTLKARPVEVMRPAFLEAKPSDGRVALVTRDRPLAEAGANGY